MAEVEVAESELCHTNIRSVHPTPVASSNIDAHEPLQSKDPDGNDKNKDHLNPEQIQMQAHHSGKPVTQMNIVNEGGVDTR